MGEQDARTIKFKSIKAKERKKLIQVGLPGFNVSAPPRKEPDRDPSDLPTRVHTFPGTHVFRHALCAPTRRACFAGLWCTERGPQGDAEEDQRLRFENLTCIDDMQGPGRGRDHV